jgi:glycosyltransferase involved in cell wall biosynthesis
VELGGAYTVVRERVRYWFARNGVMFMPMNLLILTSSFSMEPESVREGVSYRCAGLYGSLVKALLKRSPESEIYWYSVADRCIRTISRHNVLKSRSTLFKAVLNAVLRTLKGSSSLVVIVAYPSIFRVSKIRALLEYAVSIVPLRILSPSRIIVVLDDFDPPVESAYAFSEAEPPIILTLARRTLDVLSLKSASLVTIPTESYKKYIAELYHIKETKIFVVPNGSLIRHADDFPLQSKGSMMVLYSGSAMRVKDVDKLVTAISRLRQKGLLIDLYIAGKRFMELPAWVHNSQHEWPEFVKDILSQADIGVIPYPPSRLHFNYAFPAKLSDYMASGKPVVSTNLKETASIIKTYECGLVAKDWKEFEFHIERLYRDRDLARKLGENGRKAAERYLNYESLAEAFLQNLLKKLKITSQDDRAILLTLSLESAEPIEA